MSVNRVNSYRALWRRYNEKKAYDRVYSMAVILRYLKKADEEEQKIFNYFSRKAPQVASRPVNDKIWESLLAYPGVKVPFTRIFHLLYSKAPSMFVKDHKQVNLRRRDHIVDLARDRSLFAHNFRIAAKVLGGVDVELFALKDQEAPHPPGIRIELTKPTAVIAYRTMFREDKKRHLLFFIGRQLAMTRAEFILASVLPVRELENLLQAACVLVEPKFKAEGDLRGIDRARSWLKRALAAEGQAMLKRSVMEYLQDTRKYNLRRWVEAVEHSINRAGFVSCNDLDTALGILGSEKSWLTPMRPTQKVRELLLFASSQEYLRLREAIGLAVS